MLLAIRQIINDWGPIDLVQMGAPADEYDPEIERIMPLLADLTDEVALAHAIQRIFIELFDDDFDRPLAEGVVVAHRILQCVYQE